MGKTAYTALKKAEIQLNPTNSVIITKSRNESSKEIRIDLRNWYIPNGGVELVPTSKGFNLPMDLASKLVAALTEIMTEDTNGSPANTGQ